MSPRVLPAVFSVALIALTLSPVLRKPAEDGYPLSTYPMFGFRRPTKLTMDYAIGLTATNERRALRPWHTGSVEVLQARATLERAVRGGGKTIASMCAEIARRVALDPSRDDVVTIKIVTGTHDAVEYLVRHVEGIETQRGQCKVPR